MADSVADAWIRGIVAGCDGWPVSDTPYPSGTRLAESWQAGRLMGLELCGPPRLIPRQRPGSSRLDGKAAVSPDRAVRGHALERS